MYSKISKTTCNILFKLLCDVRDGSLRGSVLSFVSYKHDTDNHTFVKFFTIYIVLLLLEFPEELAVFSIFL